LYLTTLILLSLKYVWRAESFCPSGRHTCPQPPPTTTSWVPSAGRLGREAGLHWCGLPTGHRCRAHGAWKRPRACKYSGEEHLVSLDVQGLKCSSQTTQPIPLVSVMSASSCTRPDNRAAAGHRLSQHKLQKLLGRKLCENNLLTCFFVLVFALQYWGLNQGLGLSRQAHYHLNHNPSRCSCVLKYQTWKL
jgi:hypothetical protein